MGCSASLLLPRLKDPGLRCATRPSEPRQRRDAEASTLRKDVIEARTRTPASNVQSCHMYSLSVISVHPCSLSVSNPTLRCRSRSRTWYQPFHLLFVAVASLEMRTVLVQVHVHSSSTRACFTSRLVLLVARLGCHERLLPLVHQAVGRALKVARRQPVHHAGENLLELLRRQQRRLPRYRPVLPARRYISKVLFCPIRATTRTPVSTSPRPPRGWTLSPRAPRC